MNANEVAILIRAKDEATKTFKDVEQSAGSFGKTLGDVGKIAGGFLAANVIGSAVDGLRGFMSGAVSAASDLGESLNAVNVVFGESADTVLNWGKDNASSFGLSQRAFNQMATPLGAMLKNTGMGMDDVADNTINLTKRASDMASVFNTDVDDALTAIQAALRGESDPIEKYGVSLNAAAVEARALADTGKDSAKALTDQEKAAARLAIIFDQTAAVAGDFANTSDGLANSTRIQAARTEELQAKIGQKLIPVMLKINELKFALVQILADKLIPAFDTLGKLVGPILGAAFELLAEVGGRVLKFFGDFIGDIKWVLENGTGFNEKLVPQFGFIAEAIGHVVEAARTLQHFFSLGFNGGQIGGELGAIAEGSFILGQRFRVASDVIKNDVIPNVKDAQHYFALGFSGGQVGGELGTIQMAAFKVGQTFREDIIPATKEMAAFVVEQVTILVQHLDKHFARFPSYFNEEVKPALDNVMQLTITVVTAIVDFFREHWPEIMAIVQPVIDQIINSIELAATIITGVLDIIIKLLQGDWSGAWNATKNLFAEIWDSMKETVSNAKDFIIGVLSALRDIGVAMVGGLLEGAATKLGELANWFFALPGKIVDQIPNPLQVLYSIGMSIMQGLLSGLQAGWNAVAGFVSGVAGKIASLKGPIEYDRKLLIPQGKAIMAGLEEGIATGFDVQVRPRLSAITGDIGAPQGGASNGGGFNAGGPVYNYTINVHALDGTSAAQIIMRELVKWERRGGIAPGTTRAVA